MKHDVDIIEEQRYCIEYNIDGKTVVLNRNGAAADLTDVSVVADLVIGINCALINDSPLSPFTKQLNGKNLFRILDTLFYDLAFQNWTRFFEKKCDQGEKAFKKAFVEYYGFYHSFKSESTQLYQSIRAAAEDQKHYIEPEEARSEKYTIIRKSIIGNVATFQINGHLIEICLRSKPELKHAPALLSWLVSAKDAVVSESYENVVRTINIIGSKAYLQFAYAFFRDELETFLTHYAENQVTTQRMAVLPRKIMKSFFGMEQSEYYHSLLGNLEKMIPWANNYLIEGNSQEINSAKSAWVLYEQRSGEVIRYNTIFFGTTELIGAAQDFCRQEAKKYIMAEKSFAFHIHSVAHDLSSAFTALSKIGISIENVDDLTSIHFSALRSYLSDKMYSVQTQRRVLYSLKSLYSHCSKVSDCSNASLTKRILIPKREFNPTQPLSSEQLLELPEVIRQAPSYIQIAMALAIATGARANSICQLTTEDFFFGEVDNTVFITLYKTLHHQKKVVRLKIQIEEQIASQIQDFIAKTEQLRKQLDRPYLLVYRPSTERSGSKRQPKVLSANTFANEVKKCFHDTPIYDSNGFPIPCSFKTVRATFGRELFLSGLSEADAAKRMGNTATIKAEHYTTLSPEDYAQLHHDQIEQTIAPILQSGQPTITVPRQENVMYGTCNAGKECNNNNCATCDQLLQKRK